MPGVSKELALIAKNLRLFTGKDEATEGILKNMGLGIAEITENTRESMIAAAGFLVDEEILEKERIDRGEAILKRLSEDGSVPSKIRGMVIATALERLAKSREILRDPEVSMVAGVLKFQPSLDLLVGEDDESLKKLRKLGVLEVPQDIRELALESKKVLEDRRLGERERYSRAADVLSAALQPAYFGGKSSPPIKHELKLVLWEIAYSLSQQAVGK